MKVFRIAPTTTYCEGTAYVAARSTDEAIETFCESERRKFEYEKGICICNHVANMYYDIDKPFIIFDDLYLE